MKNRIAVWMLATTLMTPAASLWASAGDASQQGTNGTVSGTPSVKTPKKHHGHKHHKKPAAATPAAASASSAPGTK